MTIDDLIFVLQASKRGKGIQRRDCYTSCSDWEDAYFCSDGTPPYIDTPRYTYRVKPEPREWWAAVYDESYSGYKGQIYDSPPSTQEARHRAVIRVREVLP